MSFTDLKIADLRNIHLADLKLSGNRNIITGKNASGKTSLLEAIYFLCLSKSFRTSRSEEIVKEGQSGFQIIAKHLHKKNETIFGLQREKKKSLIKYAGKEINRISDQARIQPLILITPDSHLLVTGPPSRRRSLIDWVMFHVEHEYFSYWQRFNKNLKQRNALLRKKLEGSELDIWDEKLVESALLLEDQRRNAIATLLCKLREILSGLQDLPIELEYKKGWNEQDLHDELKKARKRDLATGYTSRGPHRADILIKTTGKQVTTVLSRGQIKLLSSAIELGKAKLLSEETGRKAVIMVDDLASELDEQTKQILYQMIDSTGLQQIITTVEANHLPEQFYDNAKMFHVEHGNFSEVVY